MHLSRDVLTKENILEWFEKEGVSSLARKIEWYITQFVGLTTAYNAYNSSIFSKEKRVFLNNLDTLRELFDWDENYTISNYWECQSPVTVEVDTHCKDRNEFIAYLKGTKRFKYPERDFIEDNYGFDMTDQWIRGDNLQSINVSNIRLKQTA